MRPEKDPACERVMVRLMKKAGVQGDVRDYVVVSGAMLLDYRQQYTLSCPATDKPVIVHKRLLHRLVGQRVAGQFWSLRLKQRLGGPHIQRGGQDVQRDSSQ